MKTRAKVPKDRDEDPARTLDVPICLLGTAVVEDTNDTHLATHQLKPERHTLQSRSRRKHSKEKLNRRLDEYDDEYLPGCRQSSVYDLKSGGKDHTNDTDDSNSHKHSSLSKKSGFKKSRNLDLVVRRMLKAKKGSKAQSISCRKEEILSKPASINAADDSIKARFHPFAHREEGGEAKVENRQFTNCFTTEGMIDVQLSSECHLQKAGGAVTSPNKDITRVHHHQSSPRDALNDPCSSPEFSPSTNTVPDTELSYLKPFVQSTSAVAAEEQLSCKEEGMSPIIKQEPAIAVSGRVSLYHRNRPVEAHSPPSSFGSNPSPERRSPSPGSPESRNTGTLPSPPELIMNSGNLYLAPSGAGMLTINGNVSPCFPTDPIRYSHGSPTSRSPRPPFPQFAYSEDGSVPGVKVAAMAASGFGLPTLVPPMSSIPQNCPQRNMFHLSDNVPSSHADVNLSVDIVDAYSRPRRVGNESGDIKVSPNAPTGPNPPRGIVGQKEAAASSVARGGSRRGGVNVDEKCPYKRPPHTYPALIASAILDSPGNLITLRGIYDYIMNNFPYYKYGHDKSAWQNSIRHNLSLNQCFVKVPRYENAAKSNYWTMTREGFEEFGSENSFKRRRRRGAALAPISAYKNKKYNNNDGSGNSKIRRANGGSTPLCNGGKATSAHLLGWGVRSRTPEPGIDYGVDRESVAASKCLKRTCSPGGKFTGGMGGKHPRMMILKQGEGPALEGLSGAGDHPQRPNSLSSVEEMQGNLNSFSKSLSAVTDNPPVENRSPVHNAGRNSPSSTKHNASQHAWMMAAVRKNLSLFPSSILSNLTSSSPSLITPRGRFPTEKQATVDTQGESLSLGPTVNNLTPVLFDNVEIGSRSFHFDNVASVSVCSFCCRFCDYRYVERSPTMLEKHCQIMHQLDITNAKAEAIAAAAVVGHPKDLGTKSPISGHDPSISATSLPNVVPGLSPSMLVAAAGYSNAQNLLAAAQAAGFGLAGTAIYPSSFSMPNSATSTAAHFTDPLVRALGQQINPGSSETTVNGEAFHRQQLAALNNAIQQAAVANLTESSGLSQDQLRHLIYQQLLMQSSFYSGNPTIAASMPRSIQGGRSDMSQLAHFWQYHQKVLEMTAQSANEKSMQDKDTQNNHGQKQPANVNRGQSSSSNLSQQNDPVCAAEDNEKQEDIHGWKQCQDCDFTAKGAHGLELHFRKAHASGTPIEEKHLREIKDDHQAIDNSTRHGNEHAVSEDRKMDTMNGKEGSLSAVFEIGRKANSSTQTVCEEERPTCQYCDVTFGDDTMYALHMTCHDRDNPFTCKICGQDCHEKYYFNVHLLRGLHQTKNAAKRHIRDELQISENRFPRQHCKSGERGFSSSGSESEGVNTDAEKHNDLNGSSRVPVPAHLGAHSEAIADAQ